MWEHLLDAVVARILAFQEGRPGPALEPALLDRG